MRRDTRGELRWTGSETTSSEARGVKKAQGRGEQGEVTALKLGTAKVELLSITHIYVNEMSRRRLFVNCGQKEVLKKKEVPVQPGINLGTIVGRVGQMQVSSGRSPVIDP